VFRLFERPKSGEKAVLVHIDFAVEAEHESLEEFNELAVSAGASPITAITGTRQSPNPKYLIGAGKVEEIRACVEQNTADVVLFNHDLSPAQERNLEKALSCRVLDRTGLILDIFAQRARSHEGRLQVELAQLQHLSTRLVRGWTHLERQKGGIGLRGPGETQLETDRRLIGARIKQLHKRLDKVSTRRNQSRRSRRKADLHTVSLVGYTNAGKSTLFNQLTRSGVYAADQLFATLDPTLRRLELSGADSLIMADTVGFIRHLPHSLVAAFRSTLEETREASLLLHVVDAHSPERHDNIEQVNNVLKEIGADQVPQIEVFNKIDMLDDQTPKIERDANGRVKRIWVSALSNNGMDLLKETLAAYFRPQTDILQLRIPSTAGRLRAKLYEIGHVLNERYLDNNDLLINVKINKDQWDHILQDEDCNSLERLIKQTKHLAGAA
jgi:GTP-binding protein HflX